LLGDYERDEYLTLRAQCVRAIEDLEAQIGGADYPLETTLTRFRRLGDILREGTPEQQKRAFGMVFSRITVDLEGKIEEVEPQPWARPLFADLAALGDNKCPQGEALYIPTN
jgi:hypothetical protein